MEGITEDIQKKYLDFIATYKREPNTVLIDAKNEQRILEEVLIDAKNERSILEEKLIGDTERHKLLTIEGLKVIQCAGSIKGGFRVALL